MSDLDWDMEDEADEPEPEDAALDEALTAYRVGEHEVRLDVPISEQAGSDAEALALADVVCALHRHVVHKIDDAKEFVKREKARLDTWLEQWTAAHEEQKEAIEARLYEYALDYHDDTKTVKLPHATLRRIAWSDRITWDEELARKYQAEHYPQDMKLSKSALKDRLTKTDDGRFVDRETGEIVPFVRMVERDGESLSVKHEEGS